ncbi:MAG: hypothetical protein AAGG38_11445 [Planctomycetota bacterium]
MAYLKSFIALAGVLSAGLTLPAHAAFTAPSWRPASLAEASATQTTYQAWDLFDAPAGPNPPDLAALNPNGQADAYDTSNASFVTSSGNVYSPTAVISFEAVVPNYDQGAGYKTEFVVQLRTQGNELDTASLTLDGVLANTLADYTYIELNRVVLGGFGGGLVDHRFSFSATGNAASHTLAWAGAASSVSQDLIAIDTRAVLIPEPASIALLGMLGVLGLRQRVACPERF